MHGEYKVPGGKLVVVDLDVSGGRLTSTRVSGDFFIEPDSALDTINAALDGLAADASLDTLTRAIDSALDEEVSLYGITPLGVATAVRRAIDGAAP
ncbi:MAG: biotin--protein ligase [Dokdonella sp.]